MESPSDKTSGPVGVGGGDGVGDGGGDGGGGGGAGVGAGEGGDTDWPEEPALPPPHPVKARMVHNAITDI